ncbi:hypothetical protein VTN00DRAFT_3981 [Thermoascus crustaceus]|uniref:uncharacterized protein n=1 Tax=Thermoascus crustaceus TaxID=5088 RepID=UPI003743E6D3
MSPTLRRLMKEAAELSCSASPSPHFCAHPVSDSNLFDWHFTIAGPPAPSPYAGGIYHGRIVLPPQYPLRPPSFRFLTPSGRFEVNREICLSISGHHEETWQPAWGIRTALLAIRSFMDAEVKGQVGGMEAREEVRREFAAKSRHWRCEVCGGKTNGEILEEWREVCRERGVDVDDEEGGQDGQDVPEGLKVGYKKDETETDNEDQRPDEKGNEQQQSETRRTVEPSTSTPSSSSSDLPPSTSTQEPSARDSASASAPRAPTTATSSSPSTSSTSVPAAPATISSSSLASSTTATTTTTATATRTTTTTIQQRTAPPPAVHSSDTDTSWLDRAIIGVVIALAFMILRKILNAEYVYDI